MVRRSDLQLGQIHQQNPRSKNTAKYRPADWLEESGSSLVVWYFGEFHCFVFI